MEKVHPLHLRVYSGRVKKKKRGRAFPRKVEDECTRMSEQREVQR